jgi:hypothetical protein
MDKSYMFNHYIHFSNQMQMHFEPGCYIIFQFKCYSYNFIFFYISQNLRTVFYTATVLPNSYMHFRILAKQAAKLTRIVVKFVI